MLLSISIILLIGMFAGWLFEKIKFPRLFGMILAGIIIGSYVLNLLDDSILGISNELRKTALIIILLRAGITLDMSDLKKIGRPALLMCFLPACFEIIGMIVLAPLLLKVSHLDAAIMGAVVGAVSPAVIVPRMINLIDNNYGTEKGIPQLILAGASVDDVFVIVMFDIFTGIAQGNSISVWKITSIPISILLGISVGIALGKLLYIYFKKIRIRDTVKIMIILALSFLLTAFEDNFNFIPFSALIAIMFSGIGIKISTNEIAARLSSKLNKLWVAAEIFLFVLVGASVDITSATEYGLSAVVLIFAVLVFRALGVFICLIKTKLTAKERLFCVISYIPKATVQAAIGGLPLAMGLSCGNVVLTVSVLAILITAPFGAFGIDFSYKHMLNKEKNENPMPK